MTPTQQEQFETKCAEAISLLEHALASGSLSLTEPLTHLRLAEDRISAAMRSAVHLARNEGATWAEIGDALSMTRQAAHERFTR